MTILNEVDIINVQNTEFFSAMIIFGIIFAIASVIVFFCLKEIVLGLLMTGFCLYCFGLAGEEWCKPPDYQYTKIECTIDETVSAAELLNKYEVLGHRGEIYELKYIDPEKMEEK